MLQSRESDDGTTLNEVILIKDLSWLLFLQFEWCSWINYYTQLQMQKCKYTSNTAGLYVYDNVDLLLTFDIHFNQR